jgi:hypothetical protein
VGPWPSKMPSLMAPLLLIELILELVGATFGGMMLACICAIYILCHKLVHYTTCTTAGRAVTSLTTSTFSSITQRIIECWLDTELANRQRKKRWLLRGVLLLLFKSKLVQRKD